MVKEKKIFVLDTSVIIYDHMAAKSFKEHDVVIPITVLEELDNFKKGNDTKNFAAREFTRYIDKISDGNLLTDWVNINGKGHGMLKIEMNMSATVDAEKIFGEKKGDHRILNTALYLTEQNPKRKVILVTKDINLRIKAKSLNINAEDYSTGKIHDVTEQLYTGRSEIQKVSSEIINEIYEKGFCEPTSILKKNKPKSNHYYVLRNGTKSVLASYSPKKDTLDRVKKVTAFGINPRNAEQAFALDAIMNPEIKLISLQGVAGTGKNFFLFACGL